MHNTCPYYCIHAVITSVFSLAYLKHVGPTSLQYRILFDVGNGDNSKVVLWVQNPPIPCTPIMPWIWNGENTEHEVVHMFSWHCTYACMYICTVYVYLHCMRMVIHVNSYMYFKWDWMDLLYRSITAHVQQLYLVVTLSADNRLMTSKERWRFWRSSWRRRRRMNQSIKVRVVVVPGAC